MLLNSPVEWYNINGDFNMSDSNSRIKQASELIKESRDHVSSLLKEVDETNKKLAASEQKIKKAAELGPKIVDKLIEIGRIPETKRAAALDNMSDPSRVAGELLNIIDMVSDTKQAVSKDVEYTNKTASRHDNPLQEVDDSFRQLVGLA